VQPGGQGQQPGNGGRDSTVYQPYNPSGQPGEQGNVQGQQGSGGQMVPYEQVFGEYNDAAGEALDRSAIPPHLKGYVRDYFGELAPEN
jgi:hypothetical protein